MIATDTERVRLIRHEATHSLVAVLLGWRVRLVRIGAEHGGVVDLWPDCPRRPDYRDPSVLPVICFLMADAAAFKGGQYDGPPLPATLPPGGLRVVADIIAVLLSGFASEADPAESYRRALEVEASDARQIEVLLRHYPTAASIRDNLLGWLPAFLADEVAEPVNAIADTLVQPSAEAKASSLGAEDVHRVLAGIDRKRMATATRRLHAQLDGLSFLAQHQQRAA